MNENIITELHDVALNIAQAAARISPYVSVEDDGTDVTAILHINGLREEKCSPWVFDREQPLDRAWDITIEDDQWLVNDGCFTDAFTDQQFADWLNRMLHHDGGLEDKYMELSDNGHGTLQYALPLIMSYRQAIGSHYHVKAEI